MFHVKYNAKTREISSKMDIHISRVDEEDEELHLEMEDDKKETVQDNKQMMDAT